MFDAFPQTHVSGAARSAHCLHCGNAIVNAASAFCCAGCQTVHEAITQAGLNRYYSIKDPTIVPPSPLGATARCDKNWLLPLAARLSQAESAIELPVKLQGLRCVACVWLIQQLFERQPGAQRISINSARASAQLCVDKGFSIAAFAEELGRFGYVLGDIGQSDRGEDGLLLRTGVCAALSMNAMFFSFAIYLGLHEGPLYKLLHALNFGCASLAVLVGAPVFITSAWAALQRRILHLDLPIAVGIVLSYLAAVWSFVSGQASAAYYDSLATFIALMLLGRWLKERVVLSNRRELLTNSGLEALQVRRVRAGEVSLVQATALERADELLIPAGDLVPVAGVLMDASARCSLDWINGESEPSEYTRGQLIPAGAFNAGQSALRVQCSADFASSALVSLLGQRAQERQTADLTHSFSGWYVAAVLITGVAALAYWAFSTGDLTRGLEVMTAIYVVTCPCAIGIAVPLAEELTLSGLRQHGLFVRNASFLARARRVKRVVFDKTGTLTTGRLELADLSPLTALAPALRDLLYTMVLTSGHPKSSAVAAALRSLRARWISDVSVVEVPGQGLEARWDGRLYRLGQTAWASGASASAQDELCFSRDALPLCCLRTRESLREGARAELQWLARDGYETSILSGDRSERVQRLAAELGVPAERALGEQTPEDKARFIARHDQKDMLMIGDGVNDSLAVAQAFTSGTPSIDRAVMPSRTDFYFVTAGLAPIRLALRAAHALARVTRRNQVFAVAYNLCVVGVALCGWMRPWLAAVLMPLSSVIVLAMTSLALSRRSSLWKS